MADPRGLPTRRRRAAGRPLALCLAAGALLSVAAAGTLIAATPPLTQVAGFKYQVTGVAVSRDGRLRPYPDAAWNSWSNLKPLSLADHFICVQSVTVDPQGFLWVIDPAAPGNEFIKPGGVKLVKIDLGTNKVAQVIPFDRTAAPQSSYMNDVRVSPDGKYAFLTDSGQQGALIVVDVAAGKARRVLDGDPRTQPEPGVVPRVDGHELRRPDHRIPAFAADGIALDAAGRYLYWQTLVGRTLYRIPTRSLLTATMSPAEIGATVEKVATTNVADGLWMNEQDALFITDPANDAVRMRAPDGRISVVAKDARLRWPDSMAEGADRSI